MKSVLDDIKTPEEAARLAKIAQAVVAALWLRYGELVGVR